MKLLFVSFLTVSASAFAGPMVGGGPAAPQQQIVHAKVAFDSEVPTSTDDIANCNNGSSDEAQAAMSLALRRAEKKTCVHGGLPGTPEPGRWNAVQWQKVGWFCEASAILPCR